MKKILYISIAVLASGLFFSCSEEVSMDPLTAEQVNGISLWERITEEAPYGDYSYWPGHEGIHPGQAPHGVNHRIYINRNLMEVLPVENKRAPYGTIIVKDNLDRNNNLDKIAVMAKVEGYNTEGGEWFWAIYSKEGEVLAEGTPKGCVSCHEGMKSNDYIIVRQLDQRN